MLDKIIFKAPAKVNLFLKVISKRQDGYHNIHSGITLINLFDQLTIKKSKKTIITYEGQFSPSKGFFYDCIVKKTLKFLELDKKFNFQINIKKNIPTQAGLGSSSTNAVALLKALEKLNIHKIIPDNKFYSLLGADIPFFLFGRNAIVKGIGESIVQSDFPKYYFLLVKPKINFSTKKMYQKINTNLKNDDHIKIYSLLNKYYYKNDFQEIAVKENHHIDQLIQYLSNTNNCIFARMTGSGSCCYATFEKENFATEAQKNVKKVFPEYWSFVGQNNVKKIT